MRVVRTDPRTWIVASGGPLSAAHPPREGLTPPADSTPGVERLDRDVLSHHGVTDVLLFMGTNDIRRGAPAAQVMAAMTSIVQQVKARGIRIIGTTTIPRHNVAPAETNTGWNPDKTRIRNEVNQWIRTKAPFDQIVDSTASCAIRRTLTSCAPSSTVETASIRVRRAIT